MTNELQPSPAGSRQVANNSLPAWLAPLKAAIIMIEDGCPVIPAASMPTTDQKRWISDRATALIATLSPQAGDDRRKAFSLSKLFVSLGGASSSDSVNDARAAVYLEAMATMPAWAVEAGAMMWLRAEDLPDGSNPAFVPAPPVLAQMARKAMAKTYREIAELQRLGKAKPYHQPNKGRKEAVERILRENGFMPSDPDPTHQSAA